MAQSTVLTVVCLLMSLQCCFTGVQGDGGLGEACVSDACTNTALHVCDTNIDPPLCKIKATGDCTSNQDKCVAGATCVSDVCKCTPTTTVANGDLCDKVVGEACTADAECLDNGQCGDSGSGTCKCKDNFVPKDDNTQCLKKVDESCVNDKECLEKGECVTDGTKKCQCSADYVASEDKTKCLAKIGQPCANQADCVTSAGDCTAASPKQCACGSTKVATDDNAECKLQAGQTGCSDAAECTANAECQDDSGTKTCTCKSGFTKQTSGKCSGAAAMTASALLLTLAVLVTSRLA